MKTTLDIPDTLYREFKAKTATNGEKMRKLWRVKGRCAGASKKDI